MRVPIIAIGNSRGVRLPKAILDQVGFGAEADLTVEDGRIVLTPDTASRSGWAKAFATAPAALSEEDAEWLEAPLSDDSG